MKKWDVYAPVMILTLWRYEHFKRCIESLSKCTGAEYTEVFIGLDYPTKKEYEEGWKKIRDYLPSIQGFKKVNVFKREENYGINRNRADLKNHIHNSYDYYIFSEDDNEFAPNFLEYMNAGLVRYKDDPRILNICGCTMPWRVDYRKCIESYQWNAFPAKDYNAWGTGFWFSKLPKGTGLTKDKVLHSFWLTFKACYYGYPNAVDRMLYQLHKQSQLGDVCRRLYCAFNNKYCIFPRVSKSRSFGFDGTGMNSDNDPTWNNVVELDTSMDFCLDEFEIKDYKEVHRFVKELHGFPIGRRDIWTDFVKRYLLFRITGDNAIVPKKELPKVLFNSAFRKKIKI